MNLRCVSVGVELSRANVVFLTASSFNSIKDIFFIVGGAGESEKHRSFWNMP